MPRLRKPSRIWGTAAAASSRSTVMRTISEPARESAATCSTVLWTSAVSVLVIDWTTIGAPPPTATLPTFTWVVVCRGLGPATSVSGSISGLFMCASISGFGDIQQRISGVLDRRTRPVNQKKPSNYTQGCGTKRQAQPVMQEKIASDDAKQRGDEGKSGQFAGRIGLHQSKPERKRGSDHPDRLEHHQDNGKGRRRVGNRFPGKPSRATQDRDRGRDLVAQNLFRRRKAKPCSLGKQSRGRPQRPAADDHQVAEQHLGIDIGLRNPDRAGHTKKTQGKSAPLCRTQPLLQHLVGAECHEKWCGIEEHDGPRRRGE